MTHSYFPGKFLEDKRTATIYLFSHTSDVLLHKCLGKTKLDKVLLRIKHKEKKNFKNIWKKDERKEGYL